MVKMAHISSVQPFKKYGLVFRTVEEEDASFIVSLRTTESLARFLSPTSTDVQKQEDWIRTYKERERLNLEVYFISQNDQGERLGLNRLYNYEEDCFEVGSWIYKVGLDPGIAVLGDLAARDYGFETLGFSTCKFEVNKANLSVIRYHRAFKPEKTGETETNYIFKLSYSNYRNQRDKLLKILHYESR